MRVPFAVAAISMVIFSGCGPEDGEPAPPAPPRTLTSPTNVTRVDVSAPDGRMLKQIGSRPEIERILAFLASHRSGWKYSNVGFPTPPVELFFYSGDHRLGRFGAGRYRADCRDPSPGYFESDLALNGQLPLHGIGASEADLNAFLVLLGIPEYSLDTNDC
jgi:hypothetical protein